MKRPICDPWSRFMLARVRAALAIERRREALETYGHRTPEYEKANSKAKRAALWLDAAIEAVTE